ncbi:hypothetical protein M3Y99_00843300 [Aphelenchoides fujianensis]|nr:hypothetical protein M3Y99_00843300 [Aphelenchoides fujianensis]
MVTECALLFFFCTLAAHAEYRGGFGPRMPDAPVDFVDRLTKNRQFPPPNQAVVPYAQPTDRPPFGQSGPVYFGNVPPPPPFVPPAEPPAPRLDADLSAFGQSAAFSDRNRLFGINAPPPPPRTPDWARPYGGQLGHFPPPNGPMIATVSSDLHVVAPGRPVQNVHGNGGFVAPPNAQIDFSFGGQSAPREIGAFDTQVDRFASDRDVNNRQRVVLPPNLANAPMDSFLRRLVPDQKVRPVVPVGTQPADANTRILVAPELTKPPPTSTPAIPFGQGHTLPPERVQPYTTYPDYRADLFPRLENHAHEDLRPASGRRVGPQGNVRRWARTSTARILGQMAPINVNDRRRPWEKLPGHFETGPANRPLGGNVALETLRGFEGRRIGDDLSVSDQYAGVPMGRYGPEYPEFTTKSPEGRETTTLIGGRHQDGEGQAGDGPASRSIGAGFNIPDVPKRVHVPPGDLPPTREVDEGIRPYRGPEEITRSRYNQRSDALGGGRGRSFKLDLLNE